MGNPFLASRQGYRLGQIGFLELQLCTSYLSKNKLIQVIVCRTKLELVSFS